MTAPVSEPVCERPAPDTQAVPGPVLLRLIEATVPFAGPESLELDGVHIEAADHYLSVMATDRYTLAAAHGRAPGVRFGPVRLSLDGIERLRRTLMAHPGARVDFSAASDEWEDPELVVRDEDGGLAGAIETESARPVPWRTVLADHAPDGSSGAAAVLAIRPQFLERLQAAARLAPEDVLVWHTPAKPTGPVRIDLGWWFQALLMPAPMPVPGPGAGDRRSEDGGAPPF